MPKQPAPVLEHWYSALRSESGVCLRVSDFDKVRQALYKARKEALDPQLDTLSITQSPTDPGELWIVHSSKKGESNAS